MFLQKYINVFLLQIFKNKFNIKLFLFLLIATIQS